MTTLREGPTTLARALGSHGEDAVRWLLVNDPRPPKTPRDAAFRTYLREVRAALRAEPAAFTVAARRPLAVGRASSIVEVTLAGAGAGAERVEPGDQLMLWWRNAPDAAAGMTAGAAPPPDADVRYWSTPLPHRPSRRRRASGEAWARGVVDLAEPVTGLARAPRITPRFFTVAGVSERGVALHVTRVGAWPARAATFLHTVEPGERVYGWVLRHPHRVDRTRPGLAVATGSGAAGVFAALRHGGRGVRLVWGLGDKTPEPWVRDELDAHLASGALADVRTAAAPQRVTDLLEASLVRELLSEGGWAYVSGNEAMAAAVDAWIERAVGAEARALAAAELRYIVSA